MGRAFKNVLLLDDSEFANKFNQGILNKQDCCENISVFNDAEQALEYLESNEIPDVIFLDLKMPGMDGFEFLEQVNNKYRVIGEKPVVAILTSDIDRVDYDTAKDQYWADEYICKPLATDDIDDIIDTYFY
jgi:CheY-like chemotaxis protein